MKRLNTGASNVANLGSAGSIEEGGKPPYTPRVVQQSTVTDAKGNTMGVMAETVPKEPAYVPAYDPDSLHANSEGIIGVPNVELSEEAVNMKLAEFVYKANLKTIKAASEMEEDLQRLFDEEV